MGSVQLVCRPDPAGGSDPVPEVVAVGPNPAVQRWDGRWPNPAPERKRGLEAAPTWPCRGVKQA